MSPPEQAAKLTLGMTTSTCGTCRSMVPAKITSEGGDVYLQKFCPVHGEERVCIRRDVSDYIETLRYVKPAWVPAAFAGDAQSGCPDGCGFCSHHEQHLCMPIVEITDRCNLMCPVCLNSSGSQAADVAPADLSLSDFKAMLDRLLAAEKQVDVLNFSGGEPLLHPHVLALVDEAVSRKEIVRVSLSTNGLPLLANPSLLAALRERKVVISLQFDGFADSTYEVLRGRSLLQEKLALLQRLEEADITTSLTMTVAGGVNDDQFPQVLEYFFQARNIVSLMIQPIAFAGRASSLAGRARRISIPEVVSRLGESGHPAVQRRDFVPLPCSHPLCFSLAFYLMLEDGGVVSLNRLVGASTMLDALSNRVFFGLDTEEHARVKDLIYDLWSGPVGAVPEGEGVLRTLRDILKAMSDVSSSGGFDARKAFTSAERRVKSIFIHAFQDAGTFDLDRVRRCCQGYPQPDGRVIPACVRNVLHGTGRTRAAAGRGCG